jgi:hypothetical protein
LSPQDYILNNNQTLVGKKKYPLDRLCRQELLLERLEKLQLLSDPIEINKENFCIVVRFYILQDVL